MRPEGVVELDAERAEVAVLADVVRLRRVGIEDEGRLVLRARRVGEAAVSEEDTRKQVRRAPLLGARPSAERVAPGELDEPVHVLLVVVNDHRARSERYDEPGPAAAQFAP